MLKTALVNAARSCPAHSSPPADCCLPEQMAALGWKFSDLTCKPKVYAVLPSSQVCRKGDRQDRQHTPATGAQQAKRRPWGIASWPTGQTTHTMAPAPSQEQPSLRLVSTPQVSAPIRSSHSEPWVFSGSTQHWQSLSSHRNFIQSFWQPSGGY